MSVFRQAPSIHCLFVVSFALAGCSDERSSVRSSVTPPEQRDEDAGDEDAGDEGLGDRDGGRDGASPGHDGDDADAGPKDEAALDAGPDQGLPGDAGLAQIVARTGVVDEDPFTLREGGSWSNVNVSLSKRPSAPVRIGVRSTDPSQGIVEVFEVVVTPEEWFAGSQITVTAVADDIDDDDQPFDIVFDKAVSDDPAFNGLSTKKLSFMSSDADEARVAFNYLPSDLIVRETSPSTVLVRLTSKPLARVELNVVVDAEEDVALSPTTLTFDESDWDEYHELTIRGIEDQIAEATEPYTISATVTSQDGKYQALTIKPLQGECRSIDTADIQFYGPRGGLIIDERSCDTQHEVGIALTSRPLGTVRVPLSTNVANVLVSAPELFFGATNWNVRQNVFLTCQDDGMASGNSSSRLIAGPTASETDPVYGEGKTKRTLPFVFVDKQAPATP